MKQPSRFAVWVHYRLNSAVLRFGHWPAVGPFLWWAFGWWQRYM